MWGSGMMRRRKHLALAEMVTFAVRTGNFDAPWRGTPQIWEHYADEGDILRDLQQDWRTALAGAVYVAIEAGDGDLAKDVSTAFRKLSHRHRGIRQILEANAEHPAIAAAMRKEEALLASFLQAVSPVGQVATAA